MRTIKKGDVIPVLKELSYATLKKDSFEGTTAFCFDGGMIRASNFKIDAQSESFLETDQPLCINAKLLQDTISKCPTEDIKVKIESNTLHIHSGRFKSKLNMFSPDFLFRDINPGQTFIIEPELWDGIIDCATVANMTDDLTLSSVHITSDYIEASNQYQTVSYNNRFETDIDALVPSKSLLSLRNIKPKSISFIKDRTLIINTELSRFSLGLNQFDEKYNAGVHIGVAQAHLVKGQVIKPVVKEGLINAIERLNSLAGEKEYIKGKILDIDVKPGRFVLSVKSRKGSAEEIVKFKHKFKIIKLHTFLEFLLSGLIKTETPSISFLNNQVLIKNDYRTHLMSCTVI